MRFGTSGRRGEVTHLTQLEIYINAVAELEYLQSLPTSKGGIRRGEDFFFAHDLRPSSTRFAPEFGGRGELAQTIETAICDVGMRPVNLGAIPTPALACYALGQRRGCMMITGSHIPFDRNGYKTYTATRELLKQDEAPINAQVAEVRARLYDQPAAESSFNAQGMFKAGHKELSAPSDAARAHYVRRYVDFFVGKPLAGLRLLVYQHSAVGRDLLVEIVEALGAQAVPIGRSDTFVPIDTENIDDDRLAAIQALVSEAGKVDAVISTDGDSDRPLILAPEPDGVRFLSGDLVGMVVAEYLGADAVVVPITCNDGVDRGALKHIVEPKTRIGSPYVIAGMEAAQQKGRRIVCGWEPNGGFFLGSDIAITRHILEALPTRDAVLPILCVLISMREARLSMLALFNHLPKRFGDSTLLRHFPQAKGTLLVRRFMPTNAAIRKLDFGIGELQFLDSTNRNLSASAVQVQEVEALRQTLARMFTSALGFGTITRMDFTDGVRLYFSNDEVLHFRPSGNADELRIYSLAGSKDRARKITEVGAAKFEAILLQ